MTVRGLGADYSHAQTSQSGLDLPIDHFRLLGVHAATDAQAVLNALQHRLEKPPRDGFTEETLRARGELLRTSADLLTDQVRRREYENTITALAGAPDPLMPALEVPHALETGGLLLLLEAGQGTDSFELACRALQPPQAPALGSGREADLALLAGLSCRAAAVELQQSRRFEQAAQTLDRGLQLLQRMGQRPDLRQQIDRDIQQLAPFRVLDLLSRDLAATAERQQGMALLEALVSRRGGLEGEGDPGFSPEQFRLFFRQIRGFLTVQEQIDLFERWSDMGSDAADRLAIHALTASGFVQRKPERIAEARRRLESGRHRAIDTPLAHLHLLLGEVDRARSAPADGAGDALSDLCDRCRDWLRLEVLPGYRDLDVDADLEAYFSDRDVQFWVEREDRRSGRHYAPEAPAVAAPPPSVAGSPGMVDGGSGGGSGLLAAFDLPPWPELTLNPPAAGSFTAADRAPLASDDDGEEDAGGSLNLSWPRLPELPSIEPRTVAVGAAALLISVVGVWALQRRQLAVPVAQNGGQLQSPQASSSTAGSRQTTLAARNGQLRQPGTPWALQGQSPASTGRPTAGAGAPVAGSAGSSATAPAGSVLQSAGAPARPAAGASPGGAGNGSVARPVTAPGQPISAASSPATRLRPSLPLRTANPDLNQLRELLESWLAAKARVLAGMPVQSDLDELARSTAIEVLMQERTNDRQQGQTQHLKVSIRDLVIEDRTPSRIAVVATLLYSDEIREGSGRVVERTPEITLRNEYVFARDDGTWRFVANRPAVN